MATRQRARGLTRSDVLIVALVLVVVGYFANILITLYSHERILADRCLCGEHLAAIGKAMLAYANDYDGMLPLAGGRGTKWEANLQNWSASDRSEAFGLDRNGRGGEATISSSLYLLVRHMQLTPDTFVCREDKGTRAFRPEKYTGGNIQPAQLWDFGPDPSRHCSYAYHMVYSPSGLTTSREPGFAIAADRSPWIVSPVRKPRPFSDFRPDIDPWKGTSDEARVGNAAAHQRDGQNVVFLDSHVDFAKRAFCGIDDDNIYTVSGKPTTGDPLGTPPMLGSQPAGPKDSLLVNDPPLQRTKRR